MGFGLFKKIKDAFKKASTWLKDKVIKPVINIGKKVVKPILNTGIKLAPAIASAVSTAKTGSPQAGAAIGSGIQSIGRSLGYG